MTLRKRGGACPSHTPEQRELQHSPLQYQGGRGRSSAKGPGASSGPPPRHAVEGRAGCVWGWTRSDPEGLHFLWTCFINQTLLCLLAIPVPPLLGITCWRSNFKAVKYLSNFSSHQARGLQHVDYSSTKKKALKLHRTAVQKPSRPRWASICSRVRPRVSGTKRLSNSSANRATRAEGEHGPNPSRRIRPRPRPHPCTIHSQSKPKNTKEHQRSQKKGKKNIHATRRRNQNYSWMKKGHSILLRGCVRVAAKI